MVTSSEHRLAANRRNAARSTGPRTPEGKAVVALNALKHGLLSREALVKGESEAELVAFGKRMRAQLAPVGELELLLADRVVSTAWRLRRAVALEAVLLGEKGTDGSPNPLTYLGDRNRLLAFSRYEGALERALYRALAELRRLQAERGTEPVTVLDAAEVEAAAAAPGEAVSVALFRQNSTRNGDGRQHSFLAGQSLGGQRDYRPGKALPNLTKPDDLG